MNSNTDGVDGGLYKCFYIAHDKICNYYSIRKGKQVLKGKYATVEVAKKVIDTYTPHNSQSK